MRLALDIKTKAGDDSEIKIRETSEYDGALTLDRMLSETDRKAEKEKREHEQDRAAEEEAARINAEEEDDDIMTDDEINGLSAFLESMAAAAAEPDMDLTEAVEMESLDELAEAEADESFAEEE